MENNLKNLRGAVQIPRLRKAIVIFWALALITLLSPYRPPNAYAMIGLCILSMAYFYLNREKNSRLRYVRFHVYYLIPFLVLSLSFIFISTESLKVMEKEAPTILFPAITFLLLNSDFRFTKKEYDSLLAVFLFSVLGLAVFTYVRSFFYSDEFFAHEFLTFDIIHPGYFSFYCGISVFILLELTQNASKRNKWLVNLTIVAVLFYMTLLSSRMPLIATIFVLVLYYYSLGFRRMRAWKYGAALSILMVLLLVVVYNSPRLKYRFIEALEKNLNTRIVSWSAAIDVFKEQPVFGVGTGGGQSDLDRLYIRAGHDPAIYLDLNAHNYVLHILMTFGVVGLVFILLFWFEIIKQAVQARNRLLIYSLVLFLLCSMTEVLLATQKGIVFLFLFYSLNLMFTGVRDVREGNQAESLDDQSTVK